MRSVVTLTTDFGLNDSYVAAMKGVILGINPDAVLVDVTHSIEPQNVPQAAFVVGTVWSAFPEGTIHLVVVDPGVGTERRGLALKTPKATFVAPDNGVLTHVVRAYGGTGDVGPGQAPGAAKYLEAINLTNRAYWRAPVSPTFHGRDVFAPVAAHISRGVPVGEFGESVASVEMLPVVEPERRPDGSILGSIVHIDSFGNLIANIRCEKLTGKPWKTVVEVGLRRIEGLGQTYGETGGLIALAGSSGYLEIALAGGSAGKFLGARVGDPVLVRQVA